MKFALLVLISSSFAAMVIGCGDSSDTPDTGAGPNAAATGCSASGIMFSAVNADDETSDDLNALYNSDASALPNIDLSALQPQSADPSEAGFARVFAGIFGGTTGADVASYYSQRVHYAFTQSQMNTAGISPGTFPDSCWLQSTLSGSSQAGTTQGVKVEVGAQNITTLLWLEGVVNNSPVTLTVQGVDIPVTSTRTGVILLGEGYKPSETAQNGTVITIPAAFRQAILVHEGRHSDCTDGLSAHELEIMRSARSNADFAQKIPLPHCGHTHIICTSGTYKGLAACDAERFGAYTVGAVYSTALIAAQENEVSKKLMQQTSLDYYSRYIGTDTTSPDEVTPNMSSDGLTP